MVLATEHQKTLVQTRATRAENIDPEFVPFLFRFLIGPYISSGQARQKGDFCCDFNIRDN